MKSLTDEQLMEMYQNNTDGRGAIAFDHLYSRYARRMVNFFYYSLRNDHDKAQDFLHDLYLKIIENKHSFNKNQSFQAWVYRIATNMCKNEYRSASINKKYQEHVLYTANEIESDRKHIDELQGYINSLENDQRSLIVLRFKFNLSIKEISQIFECAEGTVKSRLFYATKELSKIYKK